MVGFIWNDLFLIKSTIAMKTLNSIIVHNAYNRLFLMNVFMAINLNHHIHYIHWHYMIL